MRDQLIKIECKNECGFKQTHQSKALDDTNTAITFQCQSAHRGCAGISRQLHTLKAKDLKKGLNNQNQMEE